jgi:hypothetical protein
MNGALDNSLVGLMLLASTGYAVVKLGPRRLRQRMLAGLSRVIARAPSPFGLRQIAERLSTASAGKGPGKAQGACGGCDNCGSEQTPAQQAAQTLPPPEVRVPVATIGWRADAPSPNAGKRSG